MTHKQYYRDNTLEVFEGDYCPNCLSNNITLGDLEKAGGRAAYVQDGSCPCGMRWRNMLSMTGYVALTPMAKENDSGF